MTDPSPVTLCWLTTPTEVTDSLRARLTTSWRDVANGGGAVGFAELLPVTDADVRPAVGWPVGLRFSRHGRRDEVLVTRDLRDDA